MVEVAKSVPLDLSSRIQTLLSTSHLSCESLLTMLTERAGLLDCMSQGLSQIKALTLTDTGSLGLALSELLCDTGNKSEQTYIFSDSITTDLVTSLKSFLYSQLTPFVSHLPDLADILTTLKQAKSGHDTAYHRYRRICSQLDQVLTRLDKTSPDPDQRYMDLNRLFALKKECWEANKTYKSAVEQYNAVKGRYEMEMVGGR